MEGRGCSQWLEGRQTVVAYPRPPIYYANGSGGWRCYSPNTSLSTAPFGLSSLIILPAHLPLPSLCLRIKPEPLLHPVPEFNLMLVTSNLLPHSSDALLPIRRINIYWIFTSILFRYGAHRYSLQSYHNFISRELIISARGTKQCVIRIDLNIPSVTPISLSFRLCEFRE